MSSRRLTLALLSLLLTYNARAFVVTRSTHHDNISVKNNHLESKIALHASVDNDADVSTECWNPQLRKSIGTVASLGALETLYLTVDKLTNGNNGVSTLCKAVGGQCSSVLNGPYAYIPNTPIPLALFGFIAYTSVVYLAFEPILASQNGKDIMNQDENRMLLTAITTAMAVFSVFLMTLLFGVLQENCAFCVASAAFSIISAKLAWLGGAIPKERFRQGLQWSVSTSLAAFVGSVILFTNVDPSNANIGSSDFLLADSKVPPPVTTTSTPREIELSNSLALLDSRMYGAYWCSHCYDQKLRFGQEAMSRIPYVECSSDGVNSQRQLCTDKKIPGYPTWEISGKLYPGEREIDELEELVKEMQKPK